MGPPAGRDDRRICERPERAGSLAQRRSRGRRPEGPGGTDSKRCHPVLREAPRGHLAEPMSASFNPAYGLIVVMARLTHASSSLALRFALDTGATVTVVWPERLALLGCDLSLP